MQIEAHRSAPTGDARPAWERSEPEPRRSGLLAKPPGELVERAREDVVVDPEALALRVHDAGVAQHLQMMGDGRLAQVEERHKLADADLAGVLAQHVDEL